MAALDKNRLAAAFVVGAILAAAHAFADAPDLQGQVQAVRDSIAFSKEQLKTYEWIETTVVKQKGEQKARMQNQVYYGADGALQKVPISSEKSEGRKKRGLRGKIAENKKNEVKGYLKSAVETVRLYVPPDPTRLQAGAKAGKVSFSPIEPGKRVRLDFRDYQKPGDVLGIEVDIVNNRILGLAVESYINDPGDIVTMKSQFRTLADGATYPARIALDAPKESVTVEVTNTGYRKQ